MPTLDFIRDCAEDTAKRNYQKGYQDGYANAIDEFAKKMKSLYPLAENGCGVVVNYQVNENINKIAKKLMQKG